MAILLGTSGAWATVESSLHSRYLEVSHPRNLAPLLQQAKLRRESGIEPEYLAYDKELEDAASQIDQFHRQFAENAALKTQRFAEAIAQAEQKLSEYRSHSLALRWTMLLFPMLTTLSRKKMLLKRKDQAVQALRADLSAWRQDYIYKRQHRDEMVRRRFQQIADNITALEQMLRSPELAGANAELEVIDCLKALPDAYYVCSDINLTANRKIRFQGEYLQTAQIDHLVIGPGGIFVLEVKRWSRQFVDQRQFFDPYEQVARASYLCYDLLRRHLPVIRVRSVLVNCGVLPSPQNDFHVKTVTLAQLRDYIAWFRKPMLDKDQIVRVMQILEI